MKPLFCLVCHDVVAQPPKPLVWRSCYCGRHSTWSVDKGGFTVAIYDRKGSRDQAVVLRISNALVRMSGETDAATVRKLIAQTTTGPFQAQNSLIVRSEIGKHPDLLWADAPPTGRKLSDETMGRRQLLGRLLAALWG